MNEIQKKDYAHKEYPKKFKKDDFWSQIKRTVNGKPVSEEDINLIVAHILNEMQFSLNDHLLDLGCGNGALGGRIFGNIGKYTGVDFSEYLIEVANEYFKPDNSTNYLVGDIRKFINDSNVISDVSKVMIYGCMSYLSKADFEALLQNIYNRYENVDKIFVGNIPDANKAKNFFSQRKVESYELDDSQSPIGVWWTSEEIIAVGKNAGFSTEILHMPDEFYGAGYRFDALFKKVAYK